MRTFAWNVALAVIWACLTGRLTGPSLLTGFMLGTVVLLIVGRAIEIPPPLMRARDLAGLALFFVWELVVANGRVAWDVVTPRHRMRPGVVAVPLTARTEVEITTLSSMVSLTPGTLSLDVSDDRRFLYVHAMYLHDRERLVRTIKDGFERRLLRVLR